MDPFLVFFSSFQLAYFDIAQMSCGRTQCSWRVLRSRSFVPKAPIASVDSPAGTKSVARPMLALLCEFRIGAFDSECVLLLKGRRFRWQAWAALAFGALPLLFVWPLLSAMRDYFGAHYWTHFGVIELVKVYGSILWTTSAFGVGIVAICVAAVIGPHLWPQLMDSPSSETTADDLAEDLLILGFLALPSMVFVITRLISGGMLEQICVHNPAWHSPRAGTYFFAYERESRRAIRDLPVLRRGY